MAAFAEWQRVSTFSGVAAMVSRWALSALARSRTWRHAKRWRNAWQGRQALRRCNMPDTANRQLFITAGWPCGGWRR